MPGVDYDLVIAGGGPAGLATAICAARAGLRAVVLDPRPLPRDKACGEGLMPRGVAALAAMGVALPAHVRLAGIRYIADGITAEAAFRSMAAGVRRTALIEALAAEARSSAVELVSGRVQRWRSDERAVLVTSDLGQLRARLLVAADGLHSRLRRLAGLELPAARRRRFGVRRHYRVAPWSSFVEVHWGDGAEAYVTPVGESEVGVALLSTGEALELDSLCARFPVLAARLDGAPASSQPRGGGPFACGARCRFAPGIALVGDAAGYVDPITGEGVGLAFAGAAALVDVISRGAPLASYELAYRRLTRLHRHLTRLLVTAASCRSARQLMLRSLAAQPRVFARLLELVSGPPAVKADSV